MKLKTIRDTDLYVDLDEIVALEVDKNSEELTLHTSKGEFRIDYDNECKFLVDYFTGLLEM